MKITNAGGHTWEIDHWSVRIERTRLRHLGLRRSRDRTALALAGPRCEHHNPPSCRILGRIDRIALLSALAPIADAFGLPLPGALRAMSERAQAIFMGRIAREAFAEKPTEDK